MTEDECVTRIREALTTHWTQEKQDDALSALDSLVADLASERERAEALYRHAQDQAERLRRLPALEQALSFYADDKNWPQLTVRRKRIWDDESAAQRDAGERARRALDASPAAAPEQTPDALTFVVTPDELDGGYVAECVDLPGCMSQGDTIEEALRNVGDAHAAVTREAARELAEGITLEYIDMLEQALRQIADPSYVGNYSDAEVVEIYRKWALAALDASPRVARTTGDPDVAPERGCPSCQGKGRVKSGGSVREVACPRCKGAGRVRAADAAPGQEFMGHAAVPCERCGGTGYTDSETGTATSPASVSAVECADCEDAAASAGEPRT